MKILQILAGEKFGGAETAFVDTCLAMRECGADIEVVTRDNDVRVPVMRQAGLVVHTFPFRSFCDGRTSKGIRNVIREFQPEIVQTWRSVAARKVLRWSSDMGVPPYVVVSRFGGYYKFKDFSNSDYFVAITPDIQRYLIEECGVSQEIVCAINNFAQVREGDDLEDTVRRADYGVPPDATLCLALGVLHDNKGFDTLIWAISQLQNVYLWIAGEGEERKALMRLIKTLHLEDRVSLLGWRTDHTALFREADMCVVSSRKEPFGSAFIQAWAHKVPLIATETNGPRQYVHDGEDSLVIPIDDTRIMAQAIEHLAEDKALQDRFVNTGYERYLHEFTKEKTIAQYFAFFDAIKK